jgi:hypothetical protein
MALCDKILSPHGSLDDFEQCNMPASSAFVRVYPDSLAYRLHGSVLRMCDRHAPEYRSNPHFQELTLDEAIVWEISNR